MSLLHEWIPSWLKPWGRAQAGAILYQSTSQNVYHCTVQKCASQWLRGILSDPRIVRWCGLASYQYQSHLPGKFDPRKITERRFASGFPEKTIATPIYVDYEGFASIPKPASYKAFFVMRDPRDVVVSWYFSTKLSHPSQGDIERIRQDLVRLSESDGLHYAIDYLGDYGLFQAQRSWAEAAAQDANVLLVRYEDLIGPNQVVLFEQLMQHCDIRIPPEEMAQLLGTYSFEELSGRARGDEDVKAHYRKGIAGDWRNHFDDGIERRFMDIAGDVIALWPYAD
jgi:hypothetical protein